MPEHSALRRPEATLAEGLLDLLLSDAAPAPASSGRSGAPGDLDEAAAEREVGRALSDHREHRQAWYGDLVGPLLVPVTSSALLTGTLLPSDHALRVVLTASGAVPEVLLDAARAQFLDDDRVELAGVEFPLVGPDPATAARRALDELDFTAPAWFRVPADPAWIPALDVIAEDGAESVALLMPGPGADDAIAALLRAVADRGLGLALTPEDGPELVTTEAAYGLLNLLTAVHAARGGADAAALAAVLAVTDVDAAVDAARAVDPGARDRLARVACGSVRALIEDLEAAGLIEPDVA